MYGSGNSILSCSHSAFTFPTDDTIEQVEKWTCARLLANSVSVRLAQAMTDVDPNVEHPQGQKRSII